MATVFKIIETTKRTTFNVDGAPVVLNQEYPIALQNTIEIINEFGMPAEPLDDFKYKIIVDGLESANTGTVTLSFKVDVINPTPPVDVVVTIPLNDYYLFSDYIPIDNGFDRITIGTITGKGKWYINGNMISPGQVFFYYQIIENMTFVAEDSGAQNDYNILTFYFGDKNGPYAGESSITTNVTALAEITYDDSPYLSEDVPVETHQFVLKIRKGIANAPFEITIDTSEFVNFGTDPLNQIKILDITDLTTYTSGTINYSGVLSNLGHKDLVVYVERTPHYSVETLYVTLDSVDSDPANVNPVVNIANLVIPISI